MVELYYHITFNPASDACEVVIYIKDYSYDTNFLENHLVTSMARTAFQYVKPYMDEESPRQVLVAADTTVNDLRPENNNYNHRSQYSVYDPNQMNPWPKMEELT